MTSGTSYKRGSLPAGTVAKSRTLVALLLTAVLCIVAGCGGASSDSAGRSAPTYPLQVTVAGLDEGFVVISNGLDTKRIDADPNGLALDASITLDTRLPAGAGYDVRIINDTQTQFALQCDVVRGQGVMPAGKVDNVLVRCARVKSVRLLAGAIPSDSDSRDGLATLARFLNPSGVALDRAGNVFVADTTNHTIRRITPAGVVSTFAGSARLPGSSDGVGADARFNEPTAIAIDAADNLFVTDTRNNTIRKITSDGHVTTVAGSATDPPGAGGTNVTNARFRSPQGIAVDRAGDVFVADTGNHTIRLITPAGDVSVLAGSVAGHKDDQGVNAQFTSPNGLAVDATDGLWVADTGNRCVRRITAAGAVTTLAGGVGLAGDADGTGAAARFRAPRGITLDEQGNAFVADTSNHTIRRVTPAAVVTTLAGAAQDAGTADGVGAAARFSAPQGIATGIRGDLFVADTGNNTIRRISATDRVSTVAGSTELAGASDGNGSAARFAQPGAVAVGADGIVYVADTLNSTIRRITPGGDVSTFAGSSGETGITDATGTAARFNQPSGLAVDRLGNIFVADTRNNTIRRITPDGAVSTVAGIAGPAGFGFSDGNAATAMFRAPRGVAVDADNRIHVADTGNHTIRVVTAGAVTSLAGDPLQLPGSSDGVGTAASFNSPRGIAVDAAGNLTVADHDSSVVRRITPAGAVTTVAGVAGLTGTWPSDGPGANARFDSPTGVAIDATGNGYVADTNHRAIRVLNPSTPGNFDVRTVAGGAESTLTRLGALPQWIGQPQGLALTTKRLYFTTGDAVLFIDR